MARAVADGRLSYGRTVRVGDRAVIPVARVRLAGGFGFSGQDDGGGGGVVLSRPVGYIDVGPQGARYQALGGPRRALLLAGAAGALGGTAAVGSLLGAGAAVRLARVSLGRAPRIRRRRRGRARWRRRWRRR